MVAEQGGHLTRSRPAVRHDARRIESALRPTPAIVAGLWSVILTAVATGWTATGRGYPFGPGDPSAVLSPIGGVPASLGAPVAAVVGLVGVGLALAILGRQSSHRGSRLVSGATWMLAALLLLAVPDYRLLVIVAYTPLSLVGLPFDFVSVSSYLSVFTPPVVTQVFAVGGGLAWAAVALERTPLFGSAEQAARWGRRATAVAVAIPLVYAATRWAWALGIPLGLTTELFEFGRASGLWAVGLGLATLAIVGAGLTTGLTVPWGERWPSWLPRIGGRPIPAWLPVIPAVVVAALVTSAGLMFVRLTAAGLIDEVFTPLRGIEAAGQRSRQSSCGRSGVRRWRSRGSPTPTADDRKAAPAGHDAARSTGGGDGGEQADASAAAAGRRPRRDGPTQGPQRRSGRVRTHLAGPRHPCAI